MRKPVDRDTAYNRVKFAYMAAASAFIAVAAYAIAYRLWLAFGDTLEPADSRVRGLCAGNG